MDVSNTTQLSNLPYISTIITGHNSEAKSIIESDKPAAWESTPDGTMGFNVVFTTSDFPVNMNDDRDIATSAKRIASDKLGLVNPGGTVCRIVDFAPGEEGKPLMHRTQSLDYGVVLEGNISLVLEEGTRPLKRGDVVVQRGTMHAWKNMDLEHWGRMLFVLTDAKPLEVDGKVLKEDLGSATGLIPPSGN